MNKLIANASQKISERLTWCTAQKDQAGISKDLGEGKEISEVYGLGEASLFDEFFSFLEEIKIVNLFDGLDPKKAKRSSNVNFSSVMFIYLMRIVSGVSFFWHIETVILQSQSLMRLIGFNGREIRKGTSSRGAKKKNNSENNKIDDNSDSINIRGPLCGDSIAGYVESISGNALELFFNSVIKILASKSFFPKKVHALLDASEIQSTEKCKGSGKVKKEKAPELRNRTGRIRKVWETVFGFKLWVIWDQNSKLPLAIRFTTIETADINMAQEVVQQAIENLGDHSKIVSLAFDRGFIDGKYLWWLEKMGITFYVPAKSNMDVYKDAISLVDEGVLVTEEKKRSVGYGKNKHTVIDSWVVAGIEGLVSAGFYGDLGSGSHENSKGFVPNPINAVVVLDSPYRKNNPNTNIMVILTNGSVNKPLDVYNHYDARSEIENSVFREAKQAWFIQRPARNTAEGFRSHVYLTMITIALTTAFRYWMDSQDKLEKQSIETGIRKFREKVRNENGNKLIVFDGNRYAIFEAFELVILCGTNVRKPRGVVESISKDDILRKYGAILE